MIGKPKAILAAIMLIVAVILLGLIVSAGWTVAADLRLSNALSLRVGQSDPGLIAFMQGASWIGGGTPRWIIVILLSALVWRWCGRRCAVALAGASLLANLASNALKFANIVGHECRAQCQCMGRDEHVVAANGLTAPFQIRAQAPIMAIGIVLEGKNRKKCQNRFQLVRKTRRAASFGAIAQFSGNDDAGRNQLLADFGDMCGDRALGVPDEVRQDIGIEKEHGQKATGFGAGSSICPKSSSIDASLSSRARSEGAATGSMMMREPSLRMMASSPGSSNSRGIRTAWLRPFLNNLTWRSTFMCNP